MLPITSSPLTRVGFSMLVYLFVGGLVVLLSPGDETTAQAQDNGDTVFDIEQFGEFYLVGYDKNSSSWLDMVFTGYAQPVPSSDDHTTSAGWYGVRGNVMLTPRWGEQSEEVQTVAYVVMLDVSGSMSWNFRGWGTYQDQDYQCETYDPEYPTIPYAYDASGIGDCLGGPKAYWRELTDRRIYTAREALINLLERMETNDLIRIVAFNDGVAASSDSWYVKGDTGIIEHIRTIGEYRPGGSDSPTYLTEGGTNGAAALNEARTVLDNVPPGVRPIAIYMTDSVSSLNDGYTVAPKPECESLAAHEQKNTAFCQIGVTTDGQERPITQMQSISVDIHAEMPDNFALYALGMGRLDTTGLDLVATHPDMLYAARDAAQVQNLLNQIRLESIYGECVRRTGVVVNSIAPANAPEWDTAADCTPPPPGVYGYARLSKDGVRRDVPITHDAAGNLVYSIDEGLEAGVYTLSAWVAYNAPGEPNGTRMYDTIVDQESFIRTKTITLTIPGDDSTGSIVSGPDIHLDLAADVDLCEDEGGAFCATAPVTMTLPTLTISPTVGRPGSFLTIAGSDFPAGITGTVRVNGQTVTDTVIVDAAGRLVLVLNTTGAESGVYTVTLHADAGPPAAIERSVSFELEADAPLHEPEPDTSTPVIPLLESPTAEHTLYLPLVRRGGEASTRGNITMGRSTWGGP